MSKLVILGAGTFAAELTDMVKDGDYYSVIAYVVDREKIKNRLCDSPIFYMDYYLNKVVNIEIICGTIQPGRKEFIKRAQKYNHTFAIVTHPSASLSDTIDVGDGTIISRSVIVSAYSKIGRHVVINRGANIGHNVTIEDYAVIGPGVNIAGNITIKEGARIGIGATILENITIGENAIIGAGAVVTKEIPVGVKAIGVPARWT